jgi:hypothetical protein
MSETPPDQHDARISNIELRARSHDLELLFSLATVFSLLSAPLLLINWHSESEVAWHPDLQVVIRFLVLMAGGLCYSVAVLFVLHLLARAFWIAAIGIDAYFRVDSTRSQKVGPVTAALMREYASDPQAMINSLDRLATYFFVLGVSIIALSLFALIGGSVSVAMLILEARSGAWVRYLLVALLVAFALLAAISAGVSLLDRHYGKRGREPGPKLKRLMAAFLRTGLRPKHMRFLNAFMQPIAHGQYRGAGMLLAMTMFMSSIYVFGRELTSARGSVDFEQSAQARDTRHYRDESLQRFQYRYPSIESFMVRELPLVVRIPYRVREDRAAMLRLCGEDFEKELLSCAERYWQVTLDGEVPASKSWITRVDTLSGSRAFELIINSELSDGLHQLELKAEAPRRTGAREQHQFRIQFYLAQATKQRDL